MVSLQVFQLQSTQVSGDASTVASASAATLQVFGYNTMAVNPTVAQLDSIIGVLAAGTVSGGLLGLAGTNPHPTNTAGITTLTGRGWTVQVN
jgi:hypothetical protein